MKKSLIALAALAASGFVMAQSSVTMFGIVDVGVGHVSAANSITGVSQSGNSSSRLGFRGVEDLGGGLKAGFWIEGAISPDEGTGVGGGAAGPGFEFKRRSTVQLAGNFGEVRLGRELVAGYVKASSYDPSGQVGISAIQRWSTSRVSNGVSYNTPGNLGGFSAMVHYGFGEKAGDNSFNRYLGLSVAYDNGPLSVTLAADRLNDNAGAGVDTKTWSLGASYDLGVVKPAFLYHKEKDGKIATGVYNDNDFMMFALTAPVGPGKLWGSYVRYDLKGSKNDTDGLNVGYVYDLSKRTALYGTVAYLRNKNNANMVVGQSGIGAANTLLGAAGKNSTGYQVGIRHSF